MTEPARIRANGIDFAYLEAGPADGPLRADIDEAELAPYFPAGLELAIVPSSGHFLHLDQPEAVSRRILAFFR